MLKNQGQFVHIPSLLRLVNVYFKLYIQQLLNMSRLLAVHKKLNCFNLDDLFSCLILAYICWCANNNGTKHEFYCFSVTDMWKHIKLIGSFKALRRTSFLDRTESRISCKLFSQFFFM